MIVMMNKLWIKIFSTVLTACLIFSLVSTDNDKNENKGGSWVYSNGGWWYSYSDGSYAANEYIDGYWLNGAGWYDSSWDGSWKANSTGWWFQSGSWYPTNQWLEINDEWYYFKSDGYMASNEWAGNYYLTGSGEMATDTWIGEYYVGSDGAWVPGKKKSTEQKTTEQSTTEKQTTEQKTTEEQSACTHNWVTTTTYTVFDPHFVNIFECEPVDGYDGEGLGRSPISTHGWYNYNYIKCSYCGTKYNSFDEFKKNDKCCVVAFTDKDTIGYWSDKVNGRVTTSKYDYYFDYCQKYMGCTEYQYKAYVQCNKCLGLFETGIDFSAHCNEKHNGFEHSSFLDSATSSNCIYQKTHYPELISQTSVTKCSKCGKTK